ncbi:MAG: S8 family serine peptidase, partial [Nitrospinota bacterium]
NGYIDDAIGWNFVNNSNNPFDLTGHGTHVAGLIAARWNNGLGIAGINRGARIMVLKAFNDAGKGWGSNVARAVVYAVDNGAKIINISATHDGHTKFMERALAYAMEKGVLVVVAAGNKGLDTKGVEAANQPGTLAVAATLPNDRRAGFSNWGQEVDVAAPGVDVLSLRARGTDLNRFVAEDPKKVRPREAVVGKDKAYYRTAGTSFSAPLVSGLASLIWAKHPKLTSAQVARMIRQSARDIETPGWDQFTGYGLVDARGALEADPDWFLEAKIHALRPAQVAGQPVVEVVATVDGSRLAGYEIQLGEGKAPSAWRTVAKKPGRKVVRGLVASLKPADFGGPGAWAVRIIARDRSGQTRESRGIITLQ